MLSLLARAKATFQARSGAADGYPYDLDGALRYVRPKTGVDVFPGPNNGNTMAQLGLVSGFLPMQDARVWAQGYGRLPSGPIVSAIPDNLQYQINIPGLTKYMPQS